MKSRKRMGKMVALWLELLSCKTTHLFWICSLLLCVHWTR